ncbi:MAG: hypothetical protein AAFW89_09950 [Bacteroidota bacterium]
MAYPIRIALLSGLLSLWSTALFSQFEQPTYSVSAAPDAWFNSEDGIRIGVRVLGEMDDAFNSGPHRLDAGAWFSTFLPDLPVSYFVRFTEPIPGFSTPFNEGSIYLQSSVRTGYSQHMLGAKKRIQPGFNEFRYTEIHLSISQEQLIDPVYRPFPALWQQEWKTLVRGSVVSFSENKAGIMRYELNAMHNLNVASGSFSTFDVSIEHHKAISTFWGLRTRVFWGLTSSDVAPEHANGVSFRPAAGWLNNGVSRAEGTIPSSWMDAGVFQIAGGANLRGYTERQISAIRSEGLNPSAGFYESMLAVNFDIDFRNPIGQYVSELPYLGDIIRFRSYLFFDAGWLGDPISGFSTTPATTSSFTDETMLSDAGIGFLLNINIPDYLGKERGFTIRYELPLWLSDPGNESSFKFRQLIGIGAIIRI